MKHIGNEINRILVERRIKKKDFAKKIGMTDVNLSKVLKKKSIDAELLERIAKALNIPVSYFFDEPAGGHQINASNGSIAGVNNGSFVNIQIAQQEAEIERLKAELEGVKRLIQEKDNQIELLKEMIEMLKNKK